MCSALAPPIRPNSSSACTGTLGAETSFKGDRGHLGVDAGGANASSGALSTLPPSRSSRFQSLGEQLLVPKGPGTGSLSTSQSGPLPTVEGFMSHGSSKAIVVSDNPDAKSGGLPPMSKSMISAKASLTRPASTASLPFVPNAMGLTGTGPRSRKPGCLEQDSLQRSTRPRLGSETLTQSSKPTGPMALCGMSVAGESNVSLPSMAGGPISEAYRDATPPRTLAPLAPSSVATELASAPAAEAGLTKMTQPALQSRPLQKAELVKELIDLGLSSSEANAVSGRCAPCNIEAAITWHTEHSGASTAVTEFPRASGLHLPHVGGSSSFGISHKEGIETLN